MRRCTNCGKYPFCELINEDTVSIDTNCDYWIKRRLFNENNEGSKFSTRESNS